MKFLYSKFGRFFLGLLAKFIVGFSEFIDNSVHENAVVKFLSGHERCIVIFGDSKLANFDNQRPIQVALECSRLQIKTIFVHWEWFSPVTFASFESNENLLHVSMNNHWDLEHLRSRPVKKYFIITFPAIQFLDIAFSSSGNDDVISYDVMDEWEAFNQVGQAPWYRKDIEEFLVRNANFVTVVTEPLKNKFLAFRKEISIVKNGTLSFFMDNKTERVVTSSDKDNCYTAIYAGSLNTNWIDLELMWEILDLRPGMILKIAGQTNNLNVPDRHKSRVKLLGWLEPSKLIPEYFASDFGLVPFLNNDIAPGVDPIKLYDYLASGLKVAIFGLNHLDDIGGAWKFNSAKEFANKFDEFICAKDPMDSDKILWKNRTKTMLDQIGWKQ